MERQAAVRTCLGDCNWFVAGFWSTAACISNGPRRCDGSCECVLDTCFCACCCAPVFVPLVALPYACLETARAALWAATCGYGGTRCWGCRRQGREGRTRFVPTPEPGEGHADTYLDVLSDWHFSEHTLRQDLEAQNRLMVNGVSQRFQNALLSRHAVAGSSIPTGHTSGDY